MQGDKCYLLKEAIASIRYALSSLLLRSYFVTDLMRKEMQFGVIVSFLVQIAALNGKIEKLEQTEEGFNLDYTRKDRPEIAHIKYYKVDLLDKKKIDMMISKLPHPTTVFLKAASFFMYDSYKLSDFAYLREKILSSKFNIVQSISGIPFKYFPKNDFRITFLGAYYDYAIYPIFNRIAKISRACPRDG